MERIKVKYFILILALLVSGCTWPVKECEPKIEYKTVWKTPEFTIPDRPVMRSEFYFQNDTAGDIVRKIELDLMDLTDYTLQLENILKGIKSGSNN